jgi:hypothetical protein
MVTAWFRVGAAGMRRTRLPLIGCDTVAFCWLRRHPNLPCRTGLRAVIRRRASGSPSRRGAAVVTIEAGTVIQIGLGAYLHVGHADSAGLTAESTLASPITLFD